MNNNAKRSNELAKLWCSHLLWLYCFLWIFEGALRKWLLPQLSDPLLLIRDPILILIYAIAFANKLFPQGKLLSAATICGSICTFTSLLVIPEAPGVVAFGLRTDFLYLPLVFLIPKIWSRSDVRKLGYFTLLLGVAMTPLIVAQFLAPSTALLNAGAAGSVGGQINGGGGHIRPAGTFSFILGPSCFYALVAAFIAENFFNSGTSKSRLPAWLITTSVIALMVVTGTSSSRTSLTYVVAVFVVAPVAALLIKPKLFLRFLFIAILLVFAGLLTMQLPFFSEGTEVMTARLYGGSGTLGDGLQTGLAERVALSTEQAINQLSEVPLLGYGLGMGTIAGGKILTGRNIVAFAEDDWGRVIAESGPVLGVAFIVLRLCFVFALAVPALQAMKRQSNALPLFLLISVAPAFIYGQWGQTTVLGFAVFVAGLSAAAAVSSSSLTLYTAAYPVGEMVTGVRPAKKGNEVRSET